MGIVRIVVRPSTWTMASSPRRSIVPVAAGPKGRKKKTRTLTLSKKRSKSWSIYNMKKLIIAFVGLSALDIALTIYFVDHAGGRELNPVMAAVLTWPLWAVVLFKVGLPIVLVILLGLADTLVGRYVSRKSFLSLYLNSRTVLTIAVVALVLVCLFNLGGILL